MPFKKNRNSREDKSTKFNTPARSEQGFSRSSRSQNARPEGSNNTKKKLFGEGGASPSEGGFKNAGPRRFGKPDSGKPYGEKKSFGDKSFGDKKPYGDKKSYGEKSFGDRKPFGEKSFGDKKSYGDRKPFGDKSFGDQKPYGDRKPYGEKSFGDKKPYGDRKPYGEKSFGDKKPYGDRKPYGDKSFGDQKPYGDRKPYGEKSFGDQKPYGDRKPYGEKSFGDKKPYGDRKPFGEKSFGDKKPYGDRKPFGDKTAGKSGDYKQYGDKPFKPRSDESKPFERKYRSDDGNWTSEEHFKPTRKKAALSKDDGLIRLNRYIANAGICSRRKADELIAAGVVSVNGEAITELGFKVDPAKDLIRYNGETLKREKMVYVLLNKPKDYITTTDDPQERKTVMKLVEKASRERIYPVGRLDRNTTGLLLLTNDGDLAEKLSHPRNNITKIYQVELNKNLTQGDFNKIAFGLELEDGPIKPDQVSYITGGAKNEVGIQIHSGKNRIVRRIFEHLGYEVVKLDRVVYAQLTKKDLTRGRWRYLDEKEIIQLKHLMK